MHLSEEEDSNSAVEFLSNLLDNQVFFWEKKGGSLNKFQMEQKLVSLNLVVCEQFVFNT